jgi:hypothetical protein
MLEVFADRMRVRPCLVEAECVRVERELLVSQRERTLVGGEIGLEERLPFFRAPYVLGRELRLERRVMQRPVIERGGLLVTPAFRVGSRSTPTDRSSRDAPPRP